MPVIVAFGDSNTWGFDPAGGGRMAPDVRWTGVMRAMLGVEFTVIEEGLNGRTTVFDDPIEPNRRGLDYLPPCLRSHAPLDLLIIGLGCNDMKARFNASPSMIAAGVERLVMTARAEPVGPGGQPPKILIVAPPPLAELTGFAEMFEGAPAKAPKRAPNAVAEASAPPAARTERRVVSMGRTSLDFSGYSGTAPAAVYATVTGGLVQLPSRIDGSFGSGQ